jgi:hypothetical protein
MSNAANFILKFSTSSSETSESQSPLYDVFEPHALQSDEHNSHPALRSFLSNLDDNLVGSSEYDIRSGDCLTAAECAILLKFIGTTLLTFLQTSQHTITTQSLVSAYLLNIQWTIHTPAC